MSPITLIYLMVSILLLGCGDNKAESGGLDLVGRAIDNSGQIASGGKQKNIKSKALQNVVAVDLLQDILFRFQRDRWTLTTPRAQVTAEKLKEAGIDLVFAGIPLTPGKSPLAVLEKGVSTLETLVEQTGGQVVIAKSYPDAKSIIASGRIAMMLLSEGADAFVATPSHVANLKERGLGVVGLVAARGNAFADTAASPRERGGLTAKGKAFLSHLKDAKIAVDLTHASPKAFWDARAAQAGAVMVSHTACRALMDHPRNLDDIQILALARKGGLMGLVFNPDFLTMGQEATLETVVAHILHVKSIGAIDALALGTDFDGINPPRGLEDVSKLDRLFDALIEQGLSRAEIKGIMGENATRFFDELNRKFGAVTYTEEEMYRPIAVECDSVTGEREGLAAAACDGYIHRAGTRLTPASRHRVRIKDVVSLPVALEVFGEPGDPWQVEGQNLQGKILFHRFVQLDDAGTGTMSLPQNRRLTRLFLSPTRSSELKEAVIWGTLAPEK